MFSWHEITKEFEISYDDDYHNPSDPNSMSGNIFKRGVYYIV